MSEKVTSPIIRLVKTASEQKSLEGISELLRVVTNELNGWGTLIWIPAPGASITAGQGRIFVLAYWLTKSDVRIWHELKFKSLVGIVLQTRRPVMARADDPRIAQPEPEIVRDSGKHCGCLVPMTMADGTEAVLEVYRSQDEPFTETEVDLVSEMAAVIPPLYATLTDRIGFKLTEDISQIRRRADHDGRNSAYDTALDEIAERIAKDFRCLEVSIFLQDINEDPNVCRVRAFKPVWPEKWPDKKDCRKGYGATGWVFENGKTVRIVDLAHYEDDRAWIEHQYPLLLWADSLRIRERAATYFGTERLPPLSFICSPLKVGDSIFGVIRCSGSTHNPFSFDGWQAQVLESVGAQIGAWWRDVLRKGAKEDEALSINRLLNGFHKMNKFVHKNLGKHSWDENAFFKVAMDLAHEVIPRTGSSDVRMIEGNELVIKSKSGSDWQRLPEGQPLRYKLNANPPSSTASYLVRERTGVLVYDDVENAPYRNRTFPGTRKLILAPIEAGDTIFGVLCIRSASPVPFPKNARLAAGLLGQQLGLYHSLALQILGLKTAERKNQEMIKTQASMIKDVHHQVKSPVIITHRTAQDLLEDRRLPQSLRSGVERIRGTCGNALRVVRNMGMFSDLSMGEPLHLKRAVLNRERLLLKLQDACSDHSSLADADSKISINLDQKSFQDLAGKDRVGKLIEADWTLIEQCISNLLDNAFKYSFDGTEIRVFGGTQARGTEYFIAVANEGLEVKPEEVHELKKRGYRSQDAISSTGEGSGIGLWIVDQIMRAHGGSLEIAATANGITLVKLVFSVVKGIENLTDATENLAARR